MSRVEARRYYEQQPGEPDDGYITGADARSAVDVIYRDMGSWAAAFPGARLWWEGSPHDTSGDVPDPQLGDLFFSQSGTVERWDGSQWAVVAELGIQSGAVLLNPPGNTVQGISGGLTVAGDWLAHNAPAGKNAVLYLQAGASYAYVNFQTPDTGGTKGANEVHIGVNNAGDWFLSPKKPTNAGNAIIVQHDTGRMVLGHQTDPADPDNTVATKGYADGPQVATVADLASLPAGTKLATVSAGGGYGWEKRGAYWQPSVPSGVYAPGKLLNLAAATTTTEYSVNHIAHAWGFNDLFWVSNSLLYVRYTGYYEVGLEVIFPRAGGGDSYGLPMGQKVMYLTADQYLYGRFWASSVTSAATRVFGYVQSNTGTGAATSSYGPMPQTVNTAYGQLTVKLLELRQ